MNATARALAASAPDTARPVTARPGRPGAAVPGGSLRLVPPRRRAAARAPFVALVVGLLVAGLLGLLALNTALAQDAFTLHELQRQATALHDREQQLNRSVQALQAPAALAGSAKRLGMVPGGPPVFLRLSDSAIQGPAAPGPAASGPPASGPAASNPAGSGPARAPDTGTPAHPTLAHPAPAHPAPAPAGRVATPPPRPLRAGTAPARSTPAGPAPVRPAPAAGAAR